MSFIEFKNVCKKYPGSDRNTVNDFNLNIEEKEFIAFVGPSGCGKSTTLRMIAGFEEITGGELFIDGEKVNEIAPRDRGIAMVFQNYALYPHMTVEKNIGYGLKNMKMPAEEIKKKVDWAIDILGLEEYRYRKPKNLSGGQRQRVALGRAIVKNQKVFLMDEPLSNLDAKLRVSMRTEISKLHRQLGATTIYVTHDQVEAMTMADRIVIMKDGVIQQVGKPMELYDHPKNQFVAGFIGSPQMNFFDVTVEDSTVHFSDGNSITFSDVILKKLNGRQGAMILGIRGEDIKMDAQNLDLNKANVQHAVITDTEVMGNENNLYFSFGGTRQWQGFPNMRSARSGIKSTLYLCRRKCIFLIRRQELILRRQYDETEITSESAGQLGERSQRLYLLQRILSFILPVFSLRTPLGNHALGARGE